VEVAQLIARGLGREPQFVEVAFASIDQSIARGDADIGLSGIEDTPARRAAYAVTSPYYQFREVLSVRAADAARFRSLADLRGRRVGTLGGTIAYEILLKAQQEGGVLAVSYDDDVHPYSDLLIGRLDAVLLDHVLAERRSRTTPGFVTHPEPVAVSHYVGVLAPENAQLRDRINAILKQAMQDGRLEAIFKKWQVWNDDQPTLFARVLDGAAIPPVIDYSDSTASVVKREHGDAAAVGGDAALSASAPQVGGGHAVALVRSDAGGGGVGDGDRHRPAVRSPAAARGPGGLRRADAGYATAAATLRAVLRARRRGSPARPRCGADRAGAELCRL
jgi:ABC-type amino acid transport substrate-binding protein